MGEGHGGAAQPPHRRALAVQGTGMLEGVGLQHRGVKELFDADASR